MNNFVSHFYKKLPKRTFQGGNLIGEFYFDVLNNDLSIVTYDKVGNVTGGYERCVGEDGSKYIYKNILLDGKHAVQHDYFNLESGKIETRCINDQYGDNKSGGDGGIRFNFQQFYNDGPLKENHIYVNNHKVKVDYYLKTGTIYKDKMIRADDDFLLVSKYSNLGKMVEQAMVLYDQTFDSDIETVKKIIVIFNEQENVDLKKKYAKDIKAFDDYKAAVKLRSSILTINESDD